jgi:hypothetical protein
MRQRGYAIAFAILLVAIVVGSFFGGRFVVQRFRQDFQLRRDWSPSELSTQSPESAAAEPTLAADTAVPTRRPTPSQIVVPTPVAPSPEPLETAFLPAPTAAEPTGGVEGETPEATAVSETPTSLPTQAPAEPFVAQGSVRASLGDCGGIYVLGKVVDGGGTPLPGVRLRLVDEFANEAFAVTKSGQADMGRYDFPMSGPARRLSLFIVDEGGSALSRPVSFAYYGNSGDAEATCYRIDWTRR